MNTVSGKNRSNHSPFKKGMAIFMSAALGLTAFLQPVVAVEAIPATYDEAFYATLDYYGEVLDSSVVKSYQMNGANSINDYGQYDEVVNLTDDTEAKKTDAGVAFSFDGEVPDKFYFEGKTKAPLQSMPWTLKMSYQLNGVPKKAEELAGEKGMVEIDIDAMPNPTAGEYFQNNMVLQALAMFNADDILSVEAPGAQIQMIGNLKVVLFMAMPGEEQHFVMRVGSESFEFSGMIFLAVPATLSQLDQLADLRDAKEEIEDSYNAISNSMDIILNTLDGMGGTLRGTAAGLAQLDEARQIISSGKNNVYADADTAIDDLSKLSDALTPLSGHLDTASEALTSISTQVTALSNQAQKLKTYIKRTRDTIDDIQEDTKNLYALAKDLESYEKDGKKLADALKDDFSALGKDLSDLQSSLKSMRTTLGGLQGGISKVPEITVDGMTISQIKKLVSVGEQYYPTYKSYLQLTGQSEDEYTFADFLEQQGGQSAADAKKLADLYYYSKTEDYANKIEQAESANTLIESVNDKIDEVNRVAQALATPTAGMLNSLETLCQTLGTGGLSGDLKEMSAMASDILNDISAQKGTAAALIKELDDLGDIASGVLKNLDEGLDLLKTLDDTVNSYVPKAQDALSDTKQIVNTTTTGIRDMKKFLQSLKKLLQSGGGKLDAGTKQTLQNLSAALRQSATGLDQTYAIRDAKNQITDLIDDEWDTYTGDVNNMLLMDPAAPAVSMTSAQNAAPQSIQFMMRSQEIKIDKQKAADEAAQTQSDGNFFTRIADMFKAFWNMITGIFH